MGVVTGSLWAEQVRGRWRERGSYKILTQIMAIGMQVVREISLKYANEFERLCSDGFDLLHWPR